jgi:predicted flap endonuclease-1-like 5' DNA nuclease
MISSLYSKEFILMKSRHAYHVTDDLKRINGIGPAIERRLHEADILTFGQLAALTPVKIASLVSDLAGMSAERIAELDWPGQARELAAESVPVETHHDVTDEGNPGNRQHDVSFTVKLLLNEDHSVRRTQMVDNRSRVREQWAGWNASRMEAFICQQADLRLPAAEPVPAVTVEAECEPAVEPAPETLPSATPAAEPQAPTPTKTDPGSTLHLLELEVLPADGNRPHRVFRHGLPFSVRLRLDLTRAGLPKDEPLNYTATVYVKALGGGPRQAMGEARNTIIPTNEHLTVFVPSRLLPKGSYHLVPEVTVSRRSPEPEIEAKLEGGILQVY